MALQELDVGIERSGRQDQPTELGRELGIGVSFFPAFRAGGAYGIALAPAEELDAVDQLELPRVAAEEPRIVATARWRGMTILATHLATQRDANRTQVEALTELVARSERPLILFGDLNARWPSLRPLLELGLQPALLGGCIFSLARRQIDHVLVSPPLRIRRTRLLRTIASDHHPIIVDLDAPGGV